MLREFKDQVKRGTNPRSRFYKCLRGFYRLLRGASRPCKSIRAFRRALKKSSIFTEEEELSGCSLFPEPLLDASVKIFEPSSVLDVGCGTGRSLDYFLARGVEARGVEGSSLGISKAAHPEHIFQWDLNEELNLKRKFDLVWCYEVAEHIHPEFVHSLVKTLTNHSNLILMSAAHPGQGGVGHFNEQPRDYWIARFAQYGYEHDDGSTRQLQDVWKWQAENLFVFRAVQSAHQVV